MLRRAVVFAGLVALGCDGESSTPTTTDVPTAVDAALDANAVDQPPIDAGRDGVVDAPSIEVFPEDHSTREDRVDPTLDVADAAGDASADASDVLDASMDVPADVTADVLADAATDRPDVPAPIDAPADVPPSTDVPSPTDVPVVLDDAGLPAAPTAAAGECTATERAASPAIIVESEFADSLTPSVVWNGDEFAVAWSDQRYATPEIHFARLRDPSNPGAGREVVRVTTESAGSAAANESPSLAWDGARYWVAWTRTGGGAPSVRVAAITPSGTAGATVGTPVTVSAGTAGYVARASLVAIPASEGGGLAVAWEDDRTGDNPEVYFARLDASGARVGAEVRVTNDGGLSGSPRLVHGPANTLAIAWIDERDGAGGDVYFTRLTPAGARVTGATDLRVTRDPNATSRPAIAYDGAGYGLAWENDVTTPDRPAVFFTILDATGARRTADLRLSSNLPSGAARHPTVAFGGGEFLVAWDDDRPPHVGGDLAIQRITTAGTRAHAEAFLYEDGDASRRPALAWSGTQFVVAWEDSQYGHADIWFRRVLTTECRP